MIVIHYKEGGILDNESYFQLLMLKLIAKINCFPFEKEEVYITLLVVAPVTVID